MGSALTIEQVLSRLYAIAGVGTQTPNVPIILASDIQKPLLNNQLMHVGERTQAGSSGWLGSKYTGGMTCHHMSDG